MSSLIFFAPGAECPSSPVARRRASPPPLPSSDIAPGATSTADSRFTPRVLITSTCARRKIGGASEQRRSGVAKGAGARGDEDFTKIDFTLVRSPSGVRAFSPRPRPTPMLRRLHHLRPLAHTHMLRRLHHLRPRAHAHAPPSKRPRRSRRPCHLSRLRLCTAFKFPRSSTCPAPFSPVRPTSPATRRPCLTTDATHSPVHPTIHAVTAFCPHRFAPRSFPNLKNAPFPKPRRTPTTLADKAQTRSPRHSLHP